MSSAAAATSSAILVRQKYRSLARLIKLLPETKFPPEKSWDELRTSFRAGLTADETLEGRLVKADERLSFLRMITPKSSSHSDAAVIVEGETQGEFGGGRWVYRNGKRFKGTSSSDGRTRVILNWDGKNLDPDSVKRHNHHLKRLGFRNNAHAKGIF